MIRNQPCARPGRTASLPILFVVVLAWLPFLPVIRAGYFQGDDFGFVRLFYNMPAGDVLKLFAGDVTQGIWGVRYHELRPWLAISYELDIAAWNLNAQGFHATNVALHAANCVLVFLLGCTLFQGARWTAFLGATFFALSPVAAEPASWINGRGDLIPAVFYLSSFLLFVHFVKAASRGLLAAAVAIFAAGLFAKESVMVLPLAVSAYFIWQRRGAGREAAGPRTRWQTALAPFFLVLAAYLLLRLALFGAVFSDSASQAGATGLAEFLRRQPAYAAALLFPAGLLQDVVGARPVWLVFGLMLGVMLAWGAAAWHTPRRPVLLFLGPGWYAISVLPTVAASYLSYRHLYIASAGVSLALAGLLTLFPPLKTARRWKIASVASAAFLLLVHAGVQTVLIGEWTRAGRLSKQMHDGLIGLSREIPAGSTVILAYRPLSKVFVWNWSLPYALQPPFADMHATHKIIEHPDLYCCPDWWPVRRPVVEAEVLRGTGSFYALSWHRSGERWLKTEVSRERLQKAYEQALGRPFSADPITGEEALRLFAGLARYN